MALIKMIKDESQKCRVCLDNEGIVPIFGDESNPDISVNLMTFGTIKVLKNDDFPKLICSKCFNLLDGAVTFSKTAIQSDKLLKERKKCSNHTTMPVKTEIGLIPNDNETILSKPNYPADLEIKLEDTEYLDVDAFEDDDISLMTIAKEKATTVKNEDQKKNLQPSDSQLKNKATHALKTNYIVISEGKIKTKISQQPTPVVITEVKCKICKILLSKKTYSSHLRTVHNNKIRKRPPKLCVKCNKLVGAENFSRHVKQVHAENKRPRYHKPYKCEICCMDFTEKMYAKHVRKEHKIPPKKKECPICKKMFHLNNLRRHMKVIHVSEKKPELQASEKECPVCKKMYKRSSLRRHMKALHGGEGNSKVRVECPVCKKLFSQNYYKIHKATHGAAKKNYVCDVCGKEFFYRSSFSIHKSIHIDELPYKCDHCHYRGRSKQNLRIHSRTHTKEYPYKCDQCNKRFITKSNLNVHMRRKHINLVNFVCDTCDKGFFSKLDLKRHVSFVHLGLRNHICNICGAAFGYKSNLGEHERRVHKIKKKAQNS